MRWAGWTRPSPRARGSSSLLRPGSCSGSDTSSGRSGQLLAPDHIGHAVTRRGIPTSPLARSSGRGWCGWSGCRGARGSGGQLASLQAKTNAERPFQVAERGHDRPAVAPRKVKEQGKHRRRLSQAAEAVVRARQNGRVSNPEPIAGEHPLPLRTADRAPPASDQDRPGSVTTASRSWQLADGFGTALPELPTTCSIRGSVWRLSRMACRGRYVTADGLTRRRSDQR